MKKSGGGLKRGPQEEIKLKEVKAKSEKFKIP